MSRRAAGEGSILKRADGRWSAYVTLPSGGRRYFYGQTQQEVLRKLTEARRVLASGLPVPTHRLTVAGYLRDWLIAVKRNLKPRWDTGALRAVRARARRPRHRRYPARPLAAVPSGEALPAHARCRDEPDECAPPAHGSPRCARRSGSPRARGQERGAARRPTPNGASGDERAEPGAGAGPRGGGAGRLLEALLTTGLATGMRKGELLAYGGERSTSSGGPWPSPGRSSAPRRAW